MMGPSPESITTALDQFRPALQADGFDFQVEAVSPDGVVVVQILHGADACDDCLIPDERLSSMFKTAIESVMPDVSGVELRHQKSG